MSRKALDMSGARVGRLTAVSMATERDSRGNVMWNCECECGGTRLVTACDLKAGTVKSCGCSQPYRGRERGKEYSLYSQAKTRAKKRGIPFDLHLDDVVIPESCPVLGIAIDGTERASDRTARPSTASTTHEDTRGTTSRSSLGEQLPEA